MQHVTKQPVQLQKNFLMSLSQDLGFQLAFITIKVESLKTSCSIIWRISVELSVPERCRTTRKVMARWNAWIERCYQCWKYCWRNRTRLGKTHLIGLFTPTIARSMKRPATPHYNYFLAVPLDYQLIQLIFDLDKSSETVDYPTHASEWQRDMKRSCSLDSHHAGKSSTRSKEIYDRKAHSTVPQPGDRVLVWNLSERGGPGKLRSHWEEQVYIIEKRIADSPVYRVRPEVGLGKQRLLHRNLLLPCDALLFETPSPLKRVGDKTCQSTNAVPPNHVREDGESSDEEYTVSTPRAPSIGQRLHRDQEDVDKGAESTLLLSLTQTAVITQVSHKIRQQSQWWAAQKAQRYQMLSWTQTAMVTCSAPRQNHYVTIQKKRRPLQRAQLKPQGKRKMTRYGQREKKTATTYFYLQSDGNTWISTPSSSSTLGLDHYGDPGSSLGWLASC